MKTAKCLIGGVVLVAGFAFGTAGVASADSPNFGCRDNWNLATVDGNPVKLAKDQNDDGFVCWKFVNGKGNGPISGVVVTDNNTPPAAG